MAFMRFREITDVLLLPTRTRRHAIRSLSTTAAGKLHFLREDYASAESAFLESLRIRLGCGRDEHGAAHGMKTALREWLDNPPSRDVDPEVLTKRTTNLATEMLKHYAKLSRQENAKRRKTAKEGKDTAE